MQNLCNKGNIVDIKSVICRFVIMVSITIYCYADTELAPIEAARLRVFETLYKEQLSSAAQKKNFLKQHFKTTGEYDIYTFPHQSIENAYHAYVNANIKNSSVDNVWHKELPKTNKAFKANSTKDNPFGYILMYIWHGDKKLHVTNTRLRGENLCAKEVLEFEEKQNATILQSSFEQYCFDEE